MSKRKAFIFCWGMLLAVSPATASQGDNRASVIFGRSVELPGLVAPTGTSVFHCDERAFIINNPNPRGVSPAATLTSLRVSPAIAEIRGIGAAQPFAAVGTYSDGSARCLTALVSWTSSDPSVATISDAFGTNGLATGNGLGLTMITAFESLNSSALLTVSPIWCRWPMGITNDRRPIGQQVRRVDEILRSSEGPRVLPVSGHRFRRSKFTMNRPSALISMSVTNR
jgi:hypothetical protein